MVSTEYITRKEACQIIGVSTSSMSRHFARIRAMNPRSIKLLGAVNRRDFEHYFNIGTSYRRGKKE